mmetsp:Transcript_42184/g.131848  ORF Transcript_42184/g.131848 Transcript_42184/m.131848 type:complete len:337 (-) Transcript_42184:49-1059(-)
MGDARGKPPRACARAASAAATGAEAEGPQRPRSASTDPQSLDSVVAPGVSPCPACDARGSSGRASAGVPGPEAEELQRLQRENADLQSRFRAGPDPEDWESWLGRAAMNASGTSRRILFLKGRLLQEEWATRRASHVLSKQQALLSQLHACALTGGVGSSGKQLSSLPGSLGEAVSAGRALLENIPDACLAETKEGSAAKELRGAAAALLGSLLAVHPHVVRRAEGGARIRSSISALSALGLADAGAAASPGGARSSPEWRSRLRPRRPEAQWCAIEEQCERRSSRQALRQGVRQMASLSSQMALELDLLQVEIDQVRALTPLRQSCVARMSMCPP